MLTLALRQMHNLDSCWENWTAGATLVSAKRDENFRSKNFSKRRKSFGACRARNRRGENQRRKIWLAAGRCTLLQFLDGNQEPSHQTVPKGSHFVRQTTKNILVSFATVNLGLNNFGSREHKKLLTLREVWLVHQSVWFPEWLRRPAPRISADTPIPSKRCANARGIRTQSVKTEDIDHAPGDGFPQAKLAHRGISEV
jgi:hypothetical protein